MIACIALLSSISKYLLLTYSSLMLFFICEPTLLNISVSMEWCGGVTVLELTTVPRAQAEHIPSPSLSGHRQSHTSVLMKHIRDGDVEAKGTFTHFDSTVFIPISCTDVRTPLCDNKGINIGAVTCLPSFWLQASSAIWEPVEKEVMERHLSCCLIRGSLNTHSFGIRKKKKGSVTIIMLTRWGRKFLPVYISKTWIFSSMTPWENYGSSLHLIRSLCSGLVHHDYCKSCSWLPWPSELPD